MNDNDPIALTQALIRCRSVTPADSGAIGVVEAALSRLGFHCHRLRFEGDGAAPVDNLYARFGTAGRNLCFAGHTDVVPPGDEGDWRSPPFEAAIVDAHLIGRGAVDMKGAIAAFIAAAGRAISAGAVTGSLSFLITGDEEGEAVNGTRKVLKWMADNNETIDHCLVGEPTNLQALGDMIKVGRRGSINCWLTVIGRQGHVAYPDRAQNPIPALLKKLLALSETPLDEGYERFQPSSLQITDIHIGNPAHNVIPAKASARFNIRFNPNWTGASITAWLRKKLDATAADTGAEFELSPVVSGEAFLTTDDGFLSTIASAVETKTGIRPEFSTSGGTSDARFIKDMAPVAEFGLVGATMHQTDENTAVSDILLLSDIYEEIISSYFRKTGGGV